MSSNLGFIELITSLSRGSAQSVSTEHDREVNAYTELKEYLYVETDVERTFVQKVNENNGKRIIFLCGSSGDGKSEILNRHSNSYADRFTFHLDATHSFKPNQNAIEALDAEFDAYKSSNKSLVVGINTGMLFNYSANGDDRHSEIKSTISNYLNRKNCDDQHAFINFEDFPKFKIVEGAFRSQFIEDIMDRLTKASSDNPIYLSFTKDRDDLEPTVKSNFMLLQEPAVRAVIIQVLLKARLKYDQFLTARTILDFLHHLILGSGHVFDNLFHKGHNDLVDVLSHFDPCTIRTQKLDQFLIQRSLRLADEGFEKFEAIAKKTYGISKLKPGSWVRAIYLMQSLDIENDFLQSFKADFEEQLFYRYSQVWDLHNSYTEGREQKTELRSFYRDEVVKSLLSFANRLEPSLTKAGRAFVGKRGRHVLSAPIDVSVNFQRIRTEINNDIANFEAPLRINGTDIPSFTVNINFMELLEKISSGYRPNVHDKNTVALLESVVEHIQQEANKSAILFVDGPGIVTSLKHDKEEDEIVVGGMT